MKLNKNSSCVFPREQRAYIAIAGLYNLICSNYANSTLEGTFLPVSEWTIPYRGQVSVRPCDCGNGGSCVSRLGAVAAAGSGEYVCVCPEGFAGRRCEVDRDDCKPNPCRLGRCIDGPDSFSCVCPPGMTGSVCCTCSRSHAKESIALRTHCIAVIDCDVLCVARQHLSGGRGRMCVGAVPPGGELPEHARVLHLRGVSEWLPRRREELRT